MYSARTYARELGIPSEDYSGKSLDQVVKMVDAKLGVPTKKAKKGTKGRPPGPRS